MKGMSEILKSSVSLTFVCYLFLSACKQQHQPDWPTVLSNRLCHLKEFFQHILQPKIERSVIQEPETFMTTPEIIANRGYPVEVHHVLTDDGYILELHRIPFGRRDGNLNNNTVQRRPVFLQHGMFCSDVFWLLSASNNSFAYILADHGYDVWLGNSRGNTYSRKHLRFNPDKDKEYWEFSWDEMGRFDIPASIDYVLNATGQSKLAAYFGYSLGSSLFFIGANHHPQLNDKAEMLIGFGPTVSLAHLSNYYRYVAPLVKLYQLYQDWSGIGEVHSTTGLLHLITRLICETSHLGAALGRQWVFQLFGPSDSYYDVDFYRLIGHHPAGGSANTMVQFLQAYNNGQSFKAFDHGPVGNMERYGTSYPPDYNLTTITVPVMLVTADSDPFVQTEDIEWLKPKLGNLKGSMRVDSPRFSHGDFVWSSRAAELVYLPILNYIPSPFVYRNSSIFQ